MKIQSKLSSDFLNKRRSNIINDFEVHFGSSWNESFPTSTNDPFFNCIIYLTKSQTIKKTYFGYFKRNVVQKDYFAVAQYNYIKNEFTVSDGFEDIINDVEECIRQIERLEEANKLGNDLKYEKNVLEPRRALAKSYINNKGNV